MARIVVQSASWALYWLMADVRQFEEFLAEVRPRLARAFVATYGLDRGQDALAESLAYAWEHFGELEAMANPAGYLYRVGASRSRRRRRPPLLPTPAEMGVPSVEPKLAEALAALTDRQRVCVAMVHGFGCTHQEVADLLGLSRSSIQNHTERGLERLRRSLGVHDDA